VDTPFGPCWRRYNHDGLAKDQMASRINIGARGVPGRLLAGELGYYEIAAGRDAGPYLRSLENFAPRHWPDPRAGLGYGEPAGSASIFLPARPGRLSLSFGHMPSM
jgi:glucoamylase